MDTSVITGIIPISKNVVQLMQNRIEEVENSATQLSQEIIFARQNGSTDRFSILLSKTQAMETVLQSLKLNLVNLSTLTRQPSDLEQKLVEMTDIYGNEIKKLSSENSHLKADKMELKERSQQIEVELQKVRLALEDTSNLVAEKNEVIEAEKSRCELLMKKITDLNRQVAEEKHIRFGLDKANNELGLRLDEMEALLKQEQTETQSFTKDFLKMKKELSKKHEELKQERETQKHMELEMVTVCQELERKLIELEQMKLEKSELTSEMGVVHEQYAQLNGQLETMQQLFNTFQKEKEELQEENQKLSDKIDELNEENTQLNQQLVRAKNNDESARLIEARRQLSQISREKDQLVNDNEALSSRVEELEATVQEMDKEISVLKNKSVKESENQFITINDLQERLSSLKSELLSLEGDKENLLTEVNGAVDAMEGERNVLQSEIESYQRQLSAALDDLEAEKMRSQQLEQHLAKSSDKTSAGDNEKALVQKNGKREVSYFDQRLADLTKQKNNLSYENGRLQSQVEQLQSELEEAQSCHGKTDKIQKRLVQAESKAKKLKAELDQCKQTLSQAELMNHQLQCMSDTRENDFKSAIRARDEAVRDAKLLATRVETLEEALRSQEQQGTGVEQQLREESSRATDSLEKVMAAHTELQCKHEQLQIDLGKKDTQLNEIKKERKRLQETLDKTKERLETADGELSSLKSKQNSRTKNIEREIKSVKGDNSKLVKTLQETLELNEQLRSQVASLEETTSKLKKECDRLNTTCKEKEAQLLKDESSYKTRITDLESQLSKERDKAYLRMEEQLHTVQKETESILDRNSDLLRQNSSLKSQLNELESEVSELNSKLDSVTKQLETAKHSLKKKSKQADSLKELEQWNEQLTKENKELSHQCKSHQKTINKFVSQFKELQGEMKQLVSLHAEQTDALEERDKLLEAEELRSDDLRNQLHHAKKQIATLQALQKATETRLVEANNDTLIAEETLEDASRYYKERFSALASELNTAKKQQADLEWRSLEKEHQLTLEKKSVEDTTRKARDMIRASRKTLTKIADRTELDSTLRESTSRELNTRTSPNARHANSKVRTPDMSLDDILSVSQQHPHPPGDINLRTGSFSSENFMSPFTSSSQKLDAIIKEMERRRLIG